jgi:hypothetical protein
MEPASRYHREAVSPSTLQSRLVGLGRRKLNSNRKVNREGGAAENSKALRAAHTCLRQRRELNYNAVCLEIIHIQDAIGLKKRDRI